MRSPSSSLTMPSVVVSTILPVLPLALAQRLLGLPVERPIGDHAERADESSVAVENRAGLEQRPELGAIPAQVLDLELLREPPARMLGAQRRHERVGHEIVEPLSEHLGGGITEHVAEALVHEGELGVGIHDRDPLVRGLHDAAIALLARAQGLLRRGEQHHAVAPGVHHRVDLAGEERLDRRFRLGEPAGEAARGERVPHGHWSAARDRSTCSVSLRLPITLCIGNGDSRSRVGVTMMLSASARRG